MVAPFLPDEEKVAAIRAELVATGAGIYLDTATAGPLPAATDRAMREWADWELRVGRIGVEAEEEFRARFDEARGTLAAILVAPIEQVDLSPSVGAAMRQAAVAHPAWRGDGPIVVASSLEPSVRSSLEGLAAASRADLVVVHIEAGAPDGATVEAFDRALSGGAALVAIPHVSPLDGSRCRIAELLPMIRRANALLAVDGSLAVGAMAADAVASGADLYATAGDRWLCGPSGTAAVYVARRPDRPGGRAGPRSPSPGAVAGLHRAAVVGLGRSAGWLAMQVGLEWAFERSRRMLAVAASALDLIAGLTFLALPERTATTLAFTVAGWPAERLRAELGRRVFALAGLVESADAIRVSVGCWNTEEEVRRFAAAVRELASTTPDEAERRGPPITVLRGDRR